MKLLSILFSSTSELCHSSAACAGFRDGALCFSLLGSECQTLFMPNRLDCTAALEPATAASVKVYNPGDINHLTARLSSLQRSLQYN